jgi:hypothetical protein
MSSQINGLHEAFAAAEDEVAIAATAAMKEVGEGLCNDFRQDVIKAGLGRKLANTWRFQVYPSHGKSLDPAAVVWSKAPKILDAFDRNPNIVPVNGGKMLAIPTKNTPNKHARGGATPMTPVEVEALYNQDLILRPGRLGHYYAFVNVVAGKSGRGFRQATRGRLAQGRKPELVQMFVLVKSVRPGKRVDIQRRIDQWAARTPGLVAGHLGN